MSTIIASSKTYELTPEQAAVLADETSPVFLPHAWQVVASMWADEEKSLAAFKTGKGVSWGEHDERLFCGVAGVLPQRLQREPRHRSGCRR